MTGKASHDIGWIGLGRMGEAMAARLVKAGHRLSVWNRTASKADPLAQIGAEVVTDKTAMAHCETVFTMVSTTDDLKDDPVRHRRRTHAAMRGPSAWSTCRRSPTPARPRSARD